MKRYDWESYYGCGEHDREPVERDDGEWVKFEDVDALTKERDELATALAKIQHDADRLSREPYSQSWTDFQAIEQTARAALLKVRD